MKRRKGRTEANNSAVSSWGQSPVGTEPHGSVIVILSGAVWRWLRERWSRVNSRKASQTCSGGVSAGMRCLLLYEPSVGAPITLGNQCNRALLFLSSWVMVKMLCFMD